MPDKNSTLSYRWMQEVWTKGREEAIDEMMDENVIVHGIENIQEKGRTAFKSFFHSFRQQFPAIEVDVQDVLTEGELESCRCLVKATSNTGHQVAFSGMTITRINNGKIIEGWNNFDFMSMYQQMGYKLSPAD
jgi:predicted ester cyclase